jgi:hypothetical protein
MTEMARVTINWTGFLGAPGYTNLYFSEFTTGGDITQTVVDDAVDRTHTWIQAWDDGLPNTVTLTIDPSVEVIEDTTGDLLRFYTATPGTPNVGGSTMPYSAASGACINWYTDGVRNGRRVRGRSFMVPIGSNGMENNGTLNGTALGTWRTATDLLIASFENSTLGVWSRPSAPAATDGIWHKTTSMTIPDKAAVLRSRRD